MRCVFTYTVLSSSVSVIKCSAGITIGVVVNNIAGTQYQLTIEGDINGTDRSKATVNKPLDDQIQPDLQTNRHYTKSCHNGRISTLPVNSAGC